MYVVHYNALALYTCYARNMFHLWDVVNTIQGSLYRVLVRFFGEYHMTL